MKNNFNRFTGILLVILSGFFIQMTRVNSAAAKNAKGASVFTKEFADGVIKGTVTDSLGEPLIGVSIKVKGTSEGTVTNAQGKFQLKASDDAILVFSYVGYQNKEVPVAGKENLKVTLVSGATGLNEVVVVGYGTQKKGDLSGSINTVKTEEITNRPSTSLTNALEGTTPGVTILSRPGDVGSDIGTVNIRGRGNLGSSAPLFVVDGVPVSAGQFARINPHDVKSMSVLKDASAAAIYGSRAANGVILVTTKTGKEGKMTINYNGYYGVQTPTVTPDWLGSYDYARLRNEAAANAGQSPLFSDEDLNAIKDGSKPDLFPNNDWYDLVLRDAAPMTEHEINVSGGGKTKYYLSGSYFLQNSILPGKDLRRYSLRANTESQVTDHFKVGTNVSYIRDGYKNDKGGLSWVSLNRMVPTMVNKQSNGDWGSINAGQVDATLAADNPLRTLDEGGRNSYATDRFKAALNATLTPIDGMEVKGLVSYDLYHSTSSAFTNTMDPIIDFFTGKPLSGSGVEHNQLNEKWQKNHRLLTQLTASYEKHLGEHYGKLLLGTSYEDFGTRFIEVKRKDFVNNSLDAINGGSTDPANTESTGNIQGDRLASFFGRFNYSFRDKYLIQANLRVDGSSQFAPRHRWGIYPSFSAAWRISSENFMDNADWITDLKLRGSWGKLGNISNVGYYDFYDALNMGTAVILDQKKQDGVWPGKLANPTLSWEKVNMANIGLDGTLWKHFTFQIDAFHKMTYGILQIDPTIPDEAGLTDDQRPVVNIAKVENKGIELTLDYHNHIGDFNYSVGGNFTRDWNTIKKMVGGDVQPTGSYWVNKVGAAVGSFYMWKAEGLFKDSADVANHATQSSNTGPGDIKYKDVNGDGKIDGDDRVIVGNDVPYITYGLHVSASYKNFDLAVMGQGVADVKVYLPQEASQAFFNGAGVKNYVLGRWTKDNPDPNAVYSRVLPAASNTQNLKTSSFWLFNASYFRIKSLSLGYTLPESVLDPLNVSRLRVYLSSNNPFIIRGDKRMKDFDPESASSRAGYPQMRSFVFGVNLTF